MSFYCLNLQVQLEQFANTFPVLNSSPSELAFVLLAGMSSGTATAIPEILTLLKGEKIHIHIQGRTQKMKFIKKVFILACLNFSHLQSTLHLMQ